VSATRAGAARAQAIAAWAATYITQTRQGEARTS
jgi:hypothetical protein